MSPKPSLHSTSPSSPPSHSNSKLPKFFHKHNRDRSKSVTDTVGENASSTSLASGSSVSHDRAGSPSPSKQSRKSKFLGRKDKSQAAEAQPDDTNPTATIKDETIEDPKSPSDPPLLVEPKPIAIPRPRTRSERPVSAADLPLQHSLYAPSGVASRSPGSSRLGERLSGWFSSAFSTSSNDLTLPAILAASSPKAKQSTASALSNVAQQSKKAFRYWILDSDATPDKCQDPIWILGVQHPGYEPPSPFPSSRSSTSGKSKSSFRSSTSSMASSANSSELSLSQSQLSTVTSGSVTPAASPNSHRHPGAHWPPVFYADFTSRIWLTYRSHFPPIRDTRLSELPETPSDAAVQLATAASTPNNPSVRARFWGGGEKGWTSDSGWGCMLRTGQSLLANALVNIYLGREWRRPPYSVHTTDYATYVQILTWFFDTPSPEAPFSVHRMASAGKELGTDIGQWFGPSIAAGAIKRLVQNFPECGLGVAVAMDNTMYQSDVSLASHGIYSSVRSTKKLGTTVWGDQPVLLLFGIRLGINGVNPIYYDTIKQLYTFPQSVGIAGGRPSSSYYFVGSQADNLFYLDPHHARLAVPLRSAPVVPNHENPHHPLHLPEATRRQRSSRANQAQYSHSSYHSETTPESDKDWVHSSPHRAGTTKRSPKSRNHTQHHRSPTSPSSIRTGSSTFSYHAPHSPSPLQKEFSSDSATSSNLTSATSAASVAGAGSISGGSSLNDWESEASSVGGGGTSSDGPHQENASPPSVNKRDSKLSAQERRRMSASQPVSPGGASDAEGANTPGMDRTYSESVNGGESSVASSSVTGSSAGMGDGAAEVVLGPIQEHYLKSYTQSELGTFHCDRVRKMPMSGLDPSMLVGFLVKDENDWFDFKKRIAELPKSVFFFQDEPPSWPSDSDDNMGLESICEPDDLDVDMDDDEEGLVVPGSDPEEDDGSDQGRPPRHKRESTNDPEIDEEDEEDEEDDDRGDRSKDGAEDEEDLDSEEQFYDTRSGGSISPSVSSQGGAGAPTAQVKKRESRSEDDTEEDPVEAVTPGPLSTKFDVQRQTPQPEHYSGKLPGSNDESGLGIGDDIEDDWVDPVVPSPSSPSTPSLQSQETGQRDGSNEPPPQITVTKSSSSGRKKKKRTGSGSGSGDAAVPMVRMPTNASQKSGRSHRSQRSRAQQQQLPFPSSSLAPDSALGDATPTGSGLERDSRPRVISGFDGKRMHTLTGRDGGRTQSGGVKGIVTEDVAVAVKSVGSS